MNEYAVAAIGEDRPGIVAAVSAALNTAGASIEDSSMTILGGHFAMLLLVQGELVADQLEAGLRPVATELELLLEVRPTTHRGVGVERDDYVVTAYGPDRPGLVTALARVLADGGANVTDFGSRVTEGGVFWMGFNVTLATGTDVGELEQQLRAAGGEVSLDVSVHRAEGESL